MVSVPARRGQVVYATGRGLSQRRACTLVQVGRSALQYRSRKAVKNAAVIARMQELSAQYPRFGYRRVRIFLGSRRLRDEPWPGASVVCGKTPGAAQAPTKAYCEL